MSTSVSRMLIRPILLTAVTLSSLSPALAKDNSTYGRPDLEITSPPPTTAPAPQLLSGNMEALLASLPARMQRLERLPAGELRSASVMAALAELLAAAAGLGKEQGQSSMLAIVNAVSVMRNADRVIRATPDIPERREAQMAMENLVNEMNNLLQASRSLKSSNDTMIATFRPALAGELAKYPNAALAGPARDLIRSTETLSLAYTKLTGFIETVVSDIIESRGNVLAGRGLANFASLDQAAAYANDPSQPFSSQTFAAQEQILLQALGTLEANYPIVK